MINSRRGAIPDDLGALVDQLDSLAARLDKLEAPSGEALSSTVAKLQALVDDIQDQLDAWVLTRWTNAQITTEINNKVATPGAIAPTTVTASGAISGTNFTASGTLNTGGDAAVGGAFYNPTGYGFDITYTRRTAWLGNDGRLGYASSSREKKEGIVSADVKRLSRLLTVEPKSFTYKAELARAIDLDKEGIDYTPARELGLMAEDLDAAGLVEFVIYNDDGEPEGIEYGQLTVALLAIARATDTRLRDLEARLK